MTENKSKTKASLFKILYLTSASGGSSVNIRKLLKNCLQKVFVVSPSDIAFVFDSNSNEVLALVLIEPNTETMHVLSLVIFQIINDDEKPGCFIHYLVTKEERIKSNNLTIQFRYQISYRLHGMAHLLLRIIQKVTEKRLESSTMVLIPAKDTDDHSSSGFYKRIGFKEELFPDSYKLSLKILNKTHFLILVDKLPYDIASIQRLSNHYSNRFKFYDGLIETFLRRQEDRINEGIQEFKKYLGKKSTRLPPPVEYDANECFQHAINYKKDEIEGMKHYFKLWGKEVSITLGDILNGDNNGIFKIDIPNLDRFLLDNVTLVPIFQISEQTIHIRIKCGFCDKSIGEDIQVQSVCEDGLFVLGTIAYHLYSVFGITSIANYHTIRDCFQSKKELMDKIAKCEYKTTRDIYKRICDIQRLDFDHANQIMREMSEELSIQLIILFRSIDNGFWIHHMEDVRGRHYKSILMLKEHVDWNMNEYYKSPNVPNVEKLLKGKRQSRERYPLRKAVY